MRQLVRQPFDSRRRARREPLENAVRSAESMRCRGVAPPPIPSGPSRLENGHSVNEREPRQCRLSSCDAQSFCYKQAVESFDSGVVAIAIAPDGAVWFGAWNFEKGRGTSRFDGQWDLSLPSPALGPA